LRNKIFFLLDIIFDYWEGKEEILIEERRKERKEEILIKHYV